MGPSISIPPDDEPERDDDEGPVHQVILRSFEMSQYAITFEQYYAFVRATEREQPSDAGIGYGTRPVINVSWDDAQRSFCW